VTDRFGRVDLREKVDRLLREEAPALGLEEVEPGLLRRAVP
jgi:hypothetical protein